MPVMFPSPSAPSAGSSRPPTASATCASVFASTGSPYSAASGSAPTPQASMTITAARAIAGRLCRCRLRHTQGVIRRLPHVDRVGIEERAATLGKRSIKTTAKQQGIRLAVSMVDLTTLEGSDTPGKVRHLCGKAVCPAPAMPEIPSVAAVCVYPSLVGVAREALEGTGVRAASVATAFPSGQASLDVKLRDTEEAVAAGADEIDMVISREAFLAGDDARVMEEIVRVKDVCGDVHLKVILETAELGSYDHVRHASMLAMEAGARFLKTPAGKAAPGAPPGGGAPVLEGPRGYRGRP